MLKAKLAALEAADKAAQQEPPAPSTAAARQAEFDGETTESSNVFWM